MFSGKSKIMKFYSFLYHYTELNLQIKSFNNLNIKNNQLSKKNQIQPFTNKSNLISVVHQLFLTFSFS